MNDSMIGTVFGRLTVIERAENYKSGASRWLCECSCGNRVIVFGQGLRRGTSKSCGCLALEIRRKTPYKHGQTDSRLYSIWHGIKKRCNTPSSTAYKTYGGRGIKVCKEWESDFEEFYNWSIRNGYKDDLELDRIDNYKGYNPDNCRWVTHKENCANRRNSKRKRPTGAPTPAGQVTIKINYNPYYTW